MSHIVRKIGFKYRTWRHTTEHYKRKWFVAVFKHYILVLCYHKCRLRTLTHIISMTLLSIILFQYLQSKCEYLVIHM